MRNPVNPFQLLAAPTIRHPAEMGIKVFVWQPFSLWRKNSADCILSHVMPLLVVLVPRRHVLTL